MLEWDTNLVIARVIAISKWPTVLSDTKAVKDDIVLIIFLYIHWKCYFIRVMAYFYMTAKFKIASVLQISPSITLILLIKSYTLLFLFYAFFCFCTLFIRVKHFPRVPPPSPPKKESITSLFIIQIYSMPILSLVRLRLLHIELLSVNTA